MPKDDTLGLAGLWTCLDNLAQTKDGEELVVAVTGVTNVSVNPRSGSESYHMNDRQANRRSSTRFLARMYSRYTIRTWRRLPKGRLLRQVLRK
jgi:hypothetical protein